MYVLYVSTLLQWKVWRWLPKLEASAIWKDVNSARPMMDTANSVIVNVIFFPPKESLFVKSVNYIWKFASSVLCVISYSYMYLHFTILCWFWILEMIPVLTCFKHTIIKNSKFDQKFSILYFICHVIGLYVNYVFICIWYMKEISLRVFSLKIYCIDVNTLYLWFFFLWNI